MSDKKIIGLEELARICEERKREGKLVVHCHGCFDLLHPGHIRHFKAAKKFGDILIVTITPDEFVRKGPGRPAFNADLRMESIASLEVVDYVALNRWDTAIETLKILKPSFYVKGKDYEDRSKDPTGNIDLEEVAVRENGGDIRFTDEIAFSSTKLINEYSDALSGEAGDFIKRWGIFRRQSKDE